MADEQAVPLLLVCGDLQQLTGSLSQCLPQGTEIRRRRTDAGQKRRVNGACQLQGHVQPFPGHQGGLLCQQPPLLRLQLGCRLHQLRYPGAGGPGPVCCRAAEELRLCHRLPLREHPLPHVGVFLHSRQGGVHIRQSRPGLRQTGSLPFQQTGPVRSGALRLPDLHAPKPLKLPQQLFPAGSHGDHPEPFHFHNGHVSLSQPFRR